MVERIKEEKSYILICTSLLKICISLRSSLLRPFVVHLDPVTMVVVVNPNNWHWVEKNTLSWSQSYFKEKLPQLQIEEDGHRVVVTDVSNVRGDSNVSQRKGKPICYFDLEISLTVAVKHGTEELISGSLRVPELTHDEEPKIQMDSSFGEHQTLLEKQFYPILLKALSQYQPDLIRAHGGDLGSNV